MNDERRAASYAAKKQEDAVNGTGRKGNCSYANVNTGEIRVEGKTGETQSWRHRGGAGSSANIIVNVK